MLTAEMSTSGVGLRKRRISPRIVADVLAIAGELFGGNRRPSFRPDAMQS